MITQSCVHAFQFIHIRIIVDRQLADQDTSDHDSLCDNWDRLLQSSSPVLQAGVVTTHHGQSIPFTDRVSQTQRASPPGTRGQLPNPTHTILGQVTSLLLGHLIRSPEFTNIAIDAATRPANGRIASVRSTPKGLATKKFLNQIHPSLDSEPTHHS